MNHAAARHLIGRLVFVLVTAAGLSAAPASRSQSPAGDTPQIAMLRKVGICGPTGECAATPDRMRQLFALAQKTEQWSPVPAVVAPAEGTTPPSDAIVLFDGRDTSAWVGSDDHDQARWPIVDGLLVPDKAAGNIETKRRFGDYQLHIEWRVPVGITGSGQGRGNSGVFLASTGKLDAGYELQILDSWQNPTYVNGQAGSIYKQYAPLVNASRPPGQWQTYDVVWTAPRFDPGGSVRTPAYVTVFHNGLLVQNHAQLKGETVFIGSPAYRAYDRAPIKLQAHQDDSRPIAFRNIWVRELNDPSQGDK